MKTLVELYRNHRGKVSDKWESYLYEYDRLFTPYRDQSVTMLEIGIQNGGSLEIWGQYFPKAKKFVGCDINPDCSKLSYNDPRIAVVVDDANTDQAQVKILKHAATFNLIIDDGSHTSEDIVKSFVRYFPYVTQGGLFIAEDLHCSYWERYGGGVYYPYSSIAFFKHLADVINFEHWGVAGKRPSVLAGLAAQYAVEFSDEMLAEIHSIEFVNSMCVIRKAPKSANTLGKRIISGLEETVVTGHHRLANSIASRPNEASNRWSNLNKNPDEIFDELSETDFQPDTRQSDSETSHLARGITAYQTNRLDEAFEHLSIALSENPDEMLAYAYLSFIAAAQGLVEEATNFVERAKQIAPTRFDLDAALGESFLKAGNPLEAESHLWSAIRHQPDLFAAYPALAEAMHQNGKTEQAIQLLASAISITSDAQNTIRTSLIELQTQKGDLSALAETCIRARTRPAIHSLGIRQLYRAGASWKRIDEELAWHVDAFLPRPDTAVAVRKTTDTCLKIGFLVSNFQRESQMGRLEALLLHLPPDRFSTLVIDNDPTAGDSETAQRCSLIADRWIGIHELNDEDAARALTDLHPDVLIDLDGHGPRQRLAVLGASPVMLKASWATCPPGQKSGIAGLNELLNCDVSEPCDDRVPDRLLAQADDFLALPNIPATITDVVTTFGCLNPVLQITESTWRLYAQLLADLPSSHLRLNLDQLGDPARAFISGIFAHYGVAADRLEFIQAIGTEALCREWRSIAVALVPPHGDGDRAFACALWMNKPLVVLAPDTPWSQRPAALLAALGHSAAVTADPAAYLALATGLATAPPRPDYRQILIDTGLTDPVRFAQGFGKVITKAYFRTCA